MLDKWLEPSKHLGDVETIVTTSEEPKPEANQTSLYRKPKLSHCINISDFEIVARNIMKLTSWNYYSTGSDDEFVSTQASSLEGLR